MAAALAGGTPNQPEVNVNSRYKIGRITLDPERKLSRKLREDIHKLIGQNLNQSTLDTIRERLKEE